MLQIKNINSPSLKVITNKIEWQESLLAADNFDFYHTYEYHHIAKRSEEKPILLKYTQGSIFIFLPLIIRKIKSTSYYDATSVYGYSGPLEKNITSEFDNSNFYKCIEQFFMLNKIVSVFSRLNPFINNQKLIFNGIGEISNIGNIVNIDLTKNIDEQRSIYSKTTKRYINKGSKLLNIHRSMTKEDILEFKKLYYQNMDRVSAKNSYYFNEEYFMKLANSTEFSTDIVFATLKDTKEIISAAMMIKTNNIIQYHISGTKSEFLELSPIRLIIDYTRIQGTKENYQYFNLGGGLGNKEDGLFKFKSSFSNDLKSFAVWKYIVDPIIYNQLIKDQGLDEETSFFPLYRLKENN